MSDPAGDGVGPGDIRGLRLSYDDPYIHVRVRTEDPIDIHATPAWVRAGSSTVLRANLDVDEDAAVDYAAVLRRGSGGPAVQLLDLQPMPSPSPRILCIAIEQPQPTMIDISVNRGCMGSAEHVRAFVRYRLDRGGDGSVNSDDRAPNTGFSPVFPFII